MDIGAVVAIVIYNGKILLGKKKSSSKKFLAGEWHVPGESLEKGESDETALIRGVKEEAGIEIKIGKYIGSHITPTSKKEARWYECFAETDKILVGSDLEAACWVEKSEVLEKCSSRATSLWPKEIIEYFKGN